MDVSFTVKPVSNKVSARIHDIFDIEVSKAQILPHSHVYATVTFTPPAMNTYMCFFEVSLNFYSEFKIVKSCCWCHN